jgi:hypothetical protein
MQPSTWLTLQAQAHFGEVEEAVHHLEGFLAIINQLNPLSPVGKAHRMILRTTFM